MNDTTEWLKVMLGEIERKRREHQEALQEAERRGDKTPPDIPEKSA